MKNRLFFLFTFYQAKIIDFFAIPFEALSKFKQKRGLELYYINNPLLDCIFIILFVGLVSIILFNKFIFGDYVFIYNQFDVSKDCIDAFYPYIYHIFNTKEGLSLWSFNSGLGNNMFPIILGFFLDPFAIIGAYFWDPIENGFIYIHIIKLICISVVFYKLILLLTENRYSALVTSIIFTFNGFLMLWGQHYFFVNKVLYFIILIYFLEKYLRTDQKILFLVALIINLTDVYFFYQNVFFIGAYLMFRSFYYNENPKIFFMRLFKVLILGIIALFAAAVFILPYVYVLGNGPRISTEKIELGKMIFSVQSFEYYLTLFGGIFSNNLSGNGLNYFGYYNNYMMAPQIYSGLLTVLLVPQVFYIKNKSHKKALLFLFLLSIVSLIFPFFAYLFTAFQELYYRWTYGIIAFNLISLSFLIKFIIKDKLLNVKILNFTFLTLMFGLLFFWMYYRRNDGEWSCNEIRGAFYADKNGQIKEVLFRVFIYLCLYFIFIQLLRKYKVSIGLVLLLTVSSELIIENYSTFYDRGIVKKNKNPYFNSSDKIVKWIQQKDKAPFYRIEKEYFSFGSGLEYNDALVHDYYGLKTYNTYNNKSYFDFCKAMNLVEKNHWSNILPSWKADMDKRRDLLSLFSVKYLLSKKVIKDSSFKLLNTKNGIHIYENNNVLPFGFTYSSVISKNNFDKLSVNEKDSVILKQLVVNDVNELKLVQKKSLTQSKFKIRDEFKISNFHNSEIKGGINCQENSVLFFSIPYDEGWEIKINGKKVHYYRVNIGFIGVKVKKGVNFLELSYCPPYLKVGALISLITILTLVLYFIYIKYRSKDFIDKIENLD